MLKLILRHARRFGARQKGNSKRFSVLLHDSALSPERVNHVHFCRNAFDLRCATNFAFFLRHPVGANGSKSVCATNKVDAFDIAACGLPFLGPLGLGSAIPKHGRSLR